MSADQLYSKYLQVRAELLAKHGKNYTQEQFTEVWMKR